jgi:uncharacterized membrane protein
VADHSTTVLLGVPIPSKDPVFLAFIVVHIAFGIAATISGAVAMLMNKGRGRHSRYGTSYFWLLAGVCITMGILSAMRWSQNYPLFILGVLALATAYVGRQFAGRYDVQGLRLHIAAMGSSYVLLLTAFYVDNGKNLPLWRELPQASMWIIPAAIGIPLILRAMFRHPFILRESARKLRGA